MDRLACVDVPDFPLQLLMKQHPEWGKISGLPIVVVEQEKHNSLILWANSAAHSHRISPGMRYSAALSLAGNLRGGVVGPDIIRDAIDSIVKQLVNFTSSVEPAAAEPGVFWLDAHGLERLHSSLNQWARNISATLKETGLFSVVVVGFSRFGTYAVAKNLTGHGGTVTVFASAKEETAATHKVSVARLGIEPAVRESLHRLGIETVASLIRLPAAGLLERFGPRIHEIHQMARGHYNTPLSPRRIDDPIQGRMDLDFPLTDWVPLLFLAGRLLDPLLGTLKVRGQVLEALILHRFLEGDGQPEQEDSIRMAVPTLDSTQILDMVRLRLEATRLPAGVIALELTALGTRPHHDQPLLFDPNSLTENGDPSNRPRRDRKAADRALARLRAAFGNDAVSRVRLRDAHLPEAQFCWEPLERTVAPMARPPPPSSKPLVRRIFAKPQPLPSRFLHTPDSWLLRGFFPGSIIKLMGPYVVRGGWWTGREVYREYHFVEMEHGEMLWIFYDHQRRRWFLQGQIC